MKLFYALLPGLLFASCATTVDVEKSIAPNGGSGHILEEGPGGPAIITVPLETPPPEVIVIEKPLYVPEGSPPAQAGPSGRPAVQRSNAEGIVEPKDYSKAAMVYDFDPDWVYEVYTQPLRVSDIRLEPGERAWEIPFVSDSERWIVGAGVSLESGLEIQHFYVKPKEANLEATLIINTDRRVYHIVLKSFRDVYMPMIRWRYFYTGLPNSYIGRGQTGRAPPLPASSPSAQEGAEDGLDPRFLSFNYRITYSRFRKPAWLPRLVYDDGRKTYISFPENVLQRQLPTVFEERNNAVNYRVLDAVIVIDKLITKITVKLENREIVIEKKSGA
jgi:type IV secretion system protein VirB9